MCAYSLAIAAAVRLKAIGITQKTLTLIVLVAIHKVAIEPDPFGPGYFIQPGGIGRNLSGGGMVLLQFLNPRQRLRQHLLHFLELCIADRGVHQRRDC